MAKRGGRFCTHCQREEYENLKFSKQTTVALRAQPDGTMVCKQCERTHKYIAPDRREGPIGPKTFPIVIEKQPRPTIQIDADLLDFLANL